MKNILKTAFATVLVATFATSALAAEYTTGVVKKVKTKTNQITVDHGPLKNLGMDTMTMVFKAGNDEILGQLKEGAKIQFIAERVKGKLTIVEIKK